MTDSPHAEPQGYRVHSNTWTVYGPQLPVDEVLGVLDRVGDRSDAVVPSERQPAVGLADQIRARLDDPTDVPLNDVRDWLTEAERRVHIHRELLEREMFHLSTGPGWRIEQTAREIRDDKTVESWIARQLRELPGGER